MSNKIQWNYNCEVIDMKQEEKRESKFEKMSTAIGDEIFDVCESLMSINPGNKSELMI